jgi:two-component system vancomycin resistance associated response regulator VraR
VPWTLLSAGQWAAVASRQKMIKRILIADDSEVFRRAVRTYLAGQNLEVCGEAIDGADLLKKAIELEPALIILDLRMPYMNGVEVTSALRRGLPNVRIILLTMYDEVTGYESLMSATGVDAIILKMRCFDSLAQCVRGLLNRPRSAAAGH